MLKTKKEIKLWLDVQAIQKYTINDDLTVDVAGTVRLDCALLEEIPVQFGIVEGFFYCSSNQLTSLKGCPSFVGKSFFCYANQLTNLDDAPKVVTDNIDCFNNPIESIKNFKTEFGGIFHHSYELGREAPIEILVPFYKDRNLREMEVNLSYKELQSILTYNELNQNVQSDSKMSNKRKKI